MTRLIINVIWWPVEHRRPIYMGEFGAYEKADLESRARWTRFLADESMKRKIGFAYWKFCSGFGLYNAKNGQWVDSLKKALKP
jgi:endoglucanase